MAQRSLLDVLSEKQCAALGVFLSCEHADLEELFAQADMQQVALLLDVFVINQSETEEGIDEETASEIKTDSAGPVTSTTSWPAFQPTKPVHATHAHGHGLAPRHGRRCSPRAHPSRERKNHLVFAHERPNRFVALTAALTHASRA